MDVVTQPTPDISRRPVASSRSKDRSRYLIYVHICVEYIYNPPLLTSCFIYRGHRNVGKLRDNRCGSFEQRVLDGFFVDLERAFVYELDCMLLEILRFPVVLLLRQKARNGFLRAATVFHKGVMLTGLIVFRRQVPNVVTLSITILQGTSNLTLLPLCDKCLVCVTLRLP